MTNNVITMPTPKHVLVERIKQSHERAILGRAEWVEGMTDEAIALAEARDQYPRGRPGDTDFGLWLATNGLDYWGKDDRAGMINLAKVAKDRGDLKFIFEQFADDRWRPDTIWRAYTQKRWEYVQVRFAELASDRPNQEAGTPTDPESAPTSASVPKSADALTSKAPILDREPEAKLNQPQIVVRSSSPLYGLKRAEEITAIFTNANTRTAIGKAIRGRHGKSIWDLLLTALDGGLLTPNSRDFRAITLNVLFPISTRGYVTRFDLTNPAHHKEVRTNLLPAMIACKDQLFANPDGLQRIIEDYLKHQADYAKTIAQQERVANAIKTLDPSHQEIRMFGTVLWPRLDPGQGEYDYDQICAAVWTFHDLNEWNQMVTLDNGLGSRAIRIRLSVKWYGEYLLHTNGRNNPMRMVFGLVSYLTRLMEKNPQGECKIPMRPLREAEW